MIHLSAADLFFRGLLYKIAPPPIRDLGNNILLVQDATTAVSFHVLWKPQHTAADATWTAQRCCGVLFSGFQIAAPLSGNTAIGIFTFSPLWPSLPWQSGAGSCNPLNIADAGTPYNTATAIDMARNEVAFASPRPPRSSRHRCRPSGGAAPPPSP